MTDLASSPTFDGWTVHLVDVSAEAAESMARLGRRVAAERGAELTYVPHRDRRDALPSTGSAATHQPLGLGVPGSVKSVFGRGSVE